MHDPQRNFSKFIERENSVVKLNITDELRMMREPQSSLRRARRLGLT